jgi:hypothetical protein
MNRRKFCLTFALGIATMVRPLLAQGPSLGFVTKLGIDVDVRSGSRILADELASNPVVLSEVAGPVSGGSVVPQIQFRGGNVQMNVPSTDYMQIFTGFRPFVHASQSEVSTAAFGQNIVVTYNDSTGIHVTPNPSGPGLIVDQVLLSSFSVSNDGGRTWTRGRMPPVAGAPETLGDPSVGVDRHGVFYFANLATTAPSGNPPTIHGAIAVNKSTDGGQTWSHGVVVQQDDASDKDWLAVGPDPVNRNRDNVYVTWTSFQSATCELRFGSSTDGGATWTAKTIFAPTADPNPTHPQNCLQSSNPVVDQNTGSLYIPFLRYSNWNQDFIQVMISDDAGATFRFANFNAPGAPDPTVLPVTQPGELTECGGADLRLTIHDAANAGPGRFGLPRYLNASRILSQPAFAARNGVLYMAWSNSASLSYGVAANSNVLFIRSDDSGNTWTAPTMVNAGVATDSQHVMPSLAIDTDPNGVHVSYYTQHTNGTVDLDMASSHDRGGTFPADRTVRVTSTSFNLPPTNIPLSNAPAFSATNYDRQIAVCYGLGEYQSVTTANGSVYVSWGDMRNLISEPVNALDPISGQSHSKADVFFQRVKAQ